ncbi:DUF1549 domain-containing protein, partial [Akkermansiaceae bacterium]|nr:DUF1549 domain-containing protein [Akkermansiaceae bacterium]
MPERTILLDRNGIEIGTIHGANRRLVEYEEVPTFLKICLFAREDARFMDHEGVDFWGLARATLRNAKDLDFTQGASTLSMQLARNTFDLREKKSLNRKFLEIAITYRIESKFSKSEILTAYLNRIYFGSGFNGIEEGAEYEVHWSYEKPVRAEVPQVDETMMKVRNPIDAFILSRLSKEDLSPSKEADPHTLIRRVALDLTGLPPTKAEVDAFLADESAKAYENLVNRLLAKPAFGEHWARMWLDLARYADSAGYADDPGRTIWAYRDWVIRAFNENMPFDQFTIDQIAGDLVPTPTEDQLIATAFHRN